MEIKISLLVRSILVVNICIVTIGSLYRNHISFYKYYFNWNHNHNPNQNQNTNNPTNMQQQHFLQQQVQQLNTVEYEVFPRWNVQEHISIPSIIHSIQSSMSGSLHFQQAHRIYIVNDQYELYFVDVPPHSRTTSDPILHGRAHIMEPFILRVLQYLKQQQQHQMEQHSLRHNEKENYYYQDAAVYNNYPYLNAIIQNGGGFVYIVNYADSGFCCTTSPYIDSQNNILFNGTYIPIFTLSAPTFCTNTFPIPNYETIQQSAEYHWEERVPHYHWIYPRRKQYHQAIWRGSPTGPKVPWDNPRVQLCLFSSIVAPDIVNAKMISIRKWDTNQVPTKTNTYTINGTTILMENTSFNESTILGDRIKMVDLQKYRAIIDVDGNSWSSRFGKLLCYSSVILKVQPNNVDYFHPTLYPFVHYIPIHANYSNLYDMVLWAISDDPQIEQIIRNANQWCIEHLNTNTILHDMIHIWDTYAYHLLSNESISVASPTGTNRSSSNSTSSSVVNAGKKLKYKNDQSLQLLHNISLEYNRLWNPVRLRFMKEYNFTLLSSSYLKSVMKKRPEKKLHIDLYYHLVLYDGICWDYILFVDVSILIIVILLYGIHKCYCCYNRIVRNF